MGNTLFMEIGDGFGNLLEFDGSLFLSQSFGFFQVGEECAFLHVLQNEVDVVTVVEEAVEFEDVLVIAVALDLDFLQKLVDHEVGLDRALADFLEGERVVGLLVDGLVDCPEFALSQRLLQLEVVDGWLLGGGVDCAVLHGLGLSQLTDILDALVGHAFLLEAEDARVAIFEEGSVGERSAAGQKGVFEVVFAFQVETGGSFGVIRSWSPFVLNLGIVLTLGYLGRVVVALVLLETLILRIFVFHVLTLSQVLSFAPIDNLLLQIIAVLPAAVVVRSGTTEIFLLPVPQGGDVGTAAKDRVSFTDIPVVTLGGVGFESGGFVELAWQTQTVGYFELREFLEFDQQFLFLIQFLHNFIIVSLRVFESFITFLRTSHFHFTASPLLRLRRLQQALPGTDNPAACFVFLASVHREIGRISQEAVQFGATLQLLDPLGRTDRIPKGGLKGALAPEAEHCRLGVVERVGPRLQVLAVVGGCSFGLGGVVDCR